MQTSNSSNRTKPVGYRLPILIVGLWLMHMQMPTESWSQEEPIVFGQPLAPSNETLPILLQADTTGAIAPLSSTDIEATDTETVEEQTSISPVSQHASDLSPLPVINITEHQSLDLMTQDTLPARELEEESISEDDSVPAGNGEIIREIEVRHVDQNGQPTEGKTRDFIITRELDLQVGDVYDPERARLSLTRIIDLNAVHNASIVLEPAATPDEVVMVITVQDASTIDVLGGTQFERPWVLQGITLPRPVWPRPGRMPGFQLPGSVVWQNIGGNDQSLTFGILAGDESAGTAITFSDPWIGESSNRLGYAVNLGWMSTLSSNFNGGEDDVALPNTNEDFWEQRVGGGVQVMQNPTPEFRWAAGLSYQVLSVRNGMFSNNLFSEDEFGNTLTLSDDGTDTLLTANFALYLNEANDLLFPTRGTRFQFGLDQSIPVGDANVFYTRPMANVTQFIPLSFIEIDGTPSTLIFNLQGGSLLGDAPPYEAFTLGGSGSVRGYTGGDAASAQTFLQGTVEYRAPFALIQWGDGFVEDLLGESTLLAGSIFFDYATGFGTQTFITGEPGVVRGKPGDGFGVGLGILATSNLGLFRFELGLNDQGDAAFYFNIGDRF